MYSNIKWQISTMQKPQLLLHQLNISCFEIKLHIPVLGRSPGEGKGYPLQYSGLENFMDCIVHGVTKSRA